MSMSQALYRHLWSSMFSNANSFYLITSSHVRGWAYLMELCPHRWHSPHSAADLNGQPIMAPSVTYSQEIQVELLVIFFMFPSFKKSWDLYQHYMYCIWYTLYVWSANYALLRQWIILDRFILQLPNLQRCKYHYYASTACCCCSLYCLRNEMCLVSSLAHALPWQRLFPPVSAPFQPRIVGFSLVPLGQLPHVRRSRVQALRVRALAINGLLPRPHPDGKTPASQFQWRHRCNR